MMSLSHIIKQHAELPGFTTVLLDAHENPVDLTSASSVTLRMQLVGDPTVVGGGTVEVLEAEAGSVLYEFVASDTQISGTYIATITAVFPGAKQQVFPFNDYWIFSVEPDLEEDADDFAGELVFATVAQARAMGKELTVHELLVAQSHVEVMCGRMAESISAAIDNDAISIADLKRLRMATVFQAAWLKANPDVEERNDVTQVRTAGLSGEAGMFTADGITLAPLARRVLIGLSWVRSRSIRTSAQRTIGTIGMRTDLGPGWKAM